MGGGTTFLLSSKFRSDLSGSGNCPYVVARLSKVVDTS